MLVELLSLFFVCGVNAKMHNLVNCPGYCISTYVLPTDGGFKEYPSNSLVAQIHLSMKRPDNNRDTYFTFDGITYLLPANVIKLIKLLGPDERKYIRVIIRQFETDKQNIKNITVVPELEKFFPDGSKQVDIQTIINIIQSRPNDINTLISTLMLQGIQPETDVQGRIISLIINGYRHLFAEPIDLSFVVSIGGKHYTLPKDINLFFADVSRNPTVIKTVIDLLKQNHVQVIIENNQLKGISLNGKIYYLPKLVPIPTPIQILVDNKVYNIPDDNNEIFHSGDATLTGKVLYILQIKGGRFTIDQNGYITDVTVSGQKVPLSPTLLTINFMKKDYIIPRDLPDLATDLGKVSGTITGLESVLNSNGIITKTDQYGKVISLTFNGQEYFIKTTTTLTVRVRIGNDDYFLPHDINVLFDLVSRNPVMIEGVVKVLKQNNISVIIRNNTLTGLSIGGTKHTLPKPIPIPVQSFKIHLGNVAYTLPQDINKIFSELNRQPGLISGFLESLKKENIEVIIKDNQLKQITIGGKTYTPPTPLVIVQQARIHLGGVAYTIPRDFKIIFEKLFREPELIMGFIELLKQQGIHATIKNYQLTGIIMSANNYKPSKPLDLPQIKIILENKTYSLPRDIRLLFNVLYRQPGLISGFIESLKQNGIRPIIENNQLKGISISGESYILREPITISSGVEPPVGKKILDIKGMRFVLPRDLQALLRFAEENGISQDSLIRYLKEKGFEVTLDISGKIASVKVIVRPTVVNVILNGKINKFEMPSELSRFMSLLKKNNISVNKVASLLRAAKVDVRQNQKGDITDIIMSGAEFSV